MNIAIFSKGTRVAVREWCTKYFYVWRCIGPYIIQQYRNWIQSVTWPERNVAWGFDVMTLRRRLRFFVFFPSSTTSLPARPPCHSHCSSYISWMASSQAHWSIFFSTIDRQRFMSTRQPPRSPFSQFPTNTGLAPLRLPSTNQHPCMGWACELCDQIPNRLNITM